MQQLLDCHVLALPGPLAWQAKASSSSPLALRSLMHALVDSLQQVDAWGIPQILVPPLAWASQLAGQDLSSCDPEWRAVQLLGPDCQSQAWASFIPSCDSIDGVSSLIAANRCAETAGSWAHARAQQLFAIFADLPQHRNLPMLAAAPQWADQGQGQHLRFANAQQARHCFAFNSGLLMPSAWKPRQGLCGQSRAAQLAKIRLARLPVRQSFVLRQHWQGLDAGAHNLRHLCCGHRDTWLIHESACGEQHSLVQSLETLLPGLRLRILRDRECRLADLRQQGLLGSTLLQDQQGRRILLYDPRWQGRRAERLRKGLLDDGLISACLPDIDPQPLKLPCSAAWRLRLELSAEQLAAVPRTFLVSAALLQALRDWTDAWLPEDWSPDWQQAADGLLQLVEAEQALLKLFDTGGEDEQATA